MKNFFEKTTCVSFLIAMEIFLSDKNCKQLHTTTLSMKIINAVNANSYQSIYIIIAMTLGPA